MSNLSTYYSFNQPDVNLNGQIVNWETGSPVYDASLNGGAYISSQNYKTGNGSLQFPKNTISSQGNVNTINITATNLIGIAVSNDNLTMFICENNGKTYYYKRANTTVSFSTSTRTLTHTSEVARAYYRIATNSNASRYVVCDNSYVYFSNWNSTTYNTLTAIDNTLRINCKGVSITPDGNKVVGCGAFGVIFTTWNTTNTNYNPFTNIPETIDSIGISISSNGNTIAYGGITTRYWYISYWNGTNFNKGTAINSTALASTFEPRSTCFNNDASILFLSYYNNDTTNNTFYPIQYVSYNKNTNSYDTFSNINTTSIPKITNGHGLCCVDSSDKCTIYAFSSATIKMYYNDLSYNTTSTNFCMIKPPTINTSGLTIACWFRSNYNSNNTRIFDFATANTATSDNIRLFINNNALTFSIYKTSTDNSFNITGNINDNSWNHIAITMSYSSGTTSTITAYINGSVANTFTGKPYPTITTRAYCYLGKSNTSTDPPFFGNIDDFRIYNSVLIQADITTLYNNTNVKNNYINSTVYLLYTTPVESNSTPITYYYWNDPYAITQAINNSANPYNFYYTYNNPYITNTNSISSLIGDFDANLNVTSSSNYVSNWVSVNDTSVSASQSTQSIQPVITQNFINSYPAIDFGTVTGSLLVTNNATTSTSNITLFFVIKLTGTKVLNQFCSTIGSWQTGVLHLIIRDDKLQISLNFGGNNDWLTPLTVAINTPYILTINISSSTGISVGSYRCNGIAGATTNTYGTSTTNISANFELGGWSGSTDRTFLGGIGEFIQYNKTLSLTEMQQVEYYLGSKWGILYPYAKVSVVTSDLVTLKLNGVIQTNLFNSGNTFASPVTVQQPLVNGDNLFEFITYSNGGSAYFAAYVTDDSATPNYLFSTISGKTGWNVNITGFFSKGYPVSSLLQNNYTSSTAITTSNYRTNNYDLSRNYTKGNVVAFTNTNISNVAISNTYSDINNVLFSYIGLPAVAASSAPVDPFTSNLIFYYKFNTGDLSNNKFKNYATGLYDTSNNNSASIYTTDYIMGNGSFICNGDITGSYFTRNGFALTTANRFTISVWFKLTSVNVGSYPFILNCLSNLNASDRIEVSFENRNPNIYVAIESPGTYYVVTDISLQILTWYYLGFCCSGNTYNVRISPESGTTTTFTRTVSSSTQKSFTNLTYIGAENANTNGIKFKGYIDDLRMYDTALSADNLTTLNNYRN
jgi:hypothetical protein